MKFDNFKLNEHVDTSGVMKITDPEIVELTEFVEDHFEKAEVSKYINNDSWERDDFPYKESSVSVTYRIKLPPIKNIECGGNPYSSNSVDISNVIIDIIKQKNAQLEFATEIKSLINRLNQYGYKVNSFSIGNPTADGELYLISIVIKDRKLKF